MKNGKHTIIRLIYGQKNKRLTEREARLILKMGVSGVSSVSQMKRFSFSLKLVFSFRPVRPVRLFLKKFRGIRDICVRPIHSLTC